MTSDTDQHRRYHLSMVDDVTTPPCPTATDMAAACGTAALGKRKRSSRITLDEDDTEGEFATSDPTTTALA